MKTFEILPGLLASNEIIILDFHQIPKDIENYKNIKSFFNSCKTNPKLPQNRQQFNNEFLTRSKKRYLIGRYCEDRIEMLRGSRIEKERRTFHLGIDIFSINQEIIYCPLDGNIVRIGNESEPQGYGNYVIIQHRVEEQILYTFYGHLSSNLPSLGPIAKGTPFARLGSSEENGGWSLHLHFQLLKMIPPEGKTPIGYSTIDDLEKNKLLFPDPQLILSL